MELAGHVQSAFNRKLVIYLQSLKKKISMKFIFWMQTKHESFLQVDANILSVFVQIKFHTLLTAK